MWRILTPVFLFLLTSATLANELDIGVSYLHYRAESNQTGQPSEFLFDPALKFDLDYRYVFAENHELSIGGDYSSLEVDTANISLFINETKFTPYSYYGKYQFWIKHGLTFTAMVGQKNFPIYDIANQGVTFSNFTPLYAGGGISLRAKNSIGTLEASYIYKHLLEKESAGETWTGNTQQIRLHLNIGRRKNQPGKFPGVLGRVSYVMYKTPMYEGSFGIIFDYNFSHLKSQYEYKVDERIFGLYYKYRFTDKYKRN